jgi:hypothetical protein
MNATVCGMYSEGSPVGTTFRNFSARGPGPNEAL